jgi:hypothetical protein
LKFNGEISTSPNFVFVSFKETMKCTKVNAEAMRATIKNFNNPFQTALHSVIGYSDLDNDRGIPTW